MGYKAFVIGQYRIRQRGNKYYVYIVEKDERGNVKETYVGPLDKIVETYLKLKGGVGVSPIVDRPGFEPGTSRMPTPKEVRQVNAFTTDECLTIDDIMLTQFQRDLLSEGVKETTIRGWLYYLKRAIGKTLCIADDVRKLWEGGSRRMWKESLSRFFSWYVKRYDKDDLITRLKKGLPERVHRGVDTYVPTDNDVLELRDALPDEYASIYNVLVLTGLRLTEALYLVNNKDKLKVVDLGNFVRIHLDLIRKNKNALVCYLPKDIFYSLKGINQHINTIEDKFCESGLCEKYLRKWFNQKVRLIVKDRDLAEFLEGRISALSVGGVHYTDLIALADREYPRVYDTLRQFIKPLGM